MEITACNRCGGTGQLTAVSLKAAPAAFHITCSNCFGAGFLDRNQRFAIAIGDMFRTTRLQLWGLGLREAAALMETTPSDLSDFEHGL